MRSILRRLAPPSFLTLALLLAGSTSLPAQVVWQDLVLSGGLSAEGYRGNLPAVTISAVDSVRSASAAVGEFGARGRLLLFNTPKRAMDLRFDAGLRQFTANGFKVRDYAPREWVGRTDLSFRETLPSLGHLRVEGGVSGRSVDDRPPMPMFIQPGYATVDGRVRLQLLPFRGASLDLQLQGEKAEYSSDEVTPQLGLLDREVLGAEAGVSFGPDWRIRVHVAFNHSEYRNQGTFDPDDPFRRDRTWSLGATWTYTSRFYAQLGLIGTVNRSNSSRPEYDAISFRGVVSAPLPHDLSLNLFATLTDKRYLTRTEFARLVPGEEADNASVVYMELARPLFQNLDGAVRFGWNRAETEIGNSYFERFGATVLLRYRPFER